MELLKLVGTATRLEKADGLGSGPMDIYPNGFYISYFFINNNFPRRVCCFQNAIHWRSKN
jgi:hypothetical protein